MSNWLAYAGAVLTGLVPPLVMYLIGSQRKVLGYAIIKNESVIGIRHPDLDRRLSVSLDGKPLSAGRVMEIIVQNLGMKDIESQTVHVTLPPGVAVLHAHSSSSTLALAPKLETAERDAYTLNIPLMNPGDQLRLTVLMSDNHAGRILVSAKGPKLRFRQFDPSAFISPVVNRSLTVLSAAVFTWIVWACTTTDRFLAKPFWEKTITCMLIVGLLALPAAVLAYHGMIPLLKRALRWKQHREHRVPAEPETDIAGHYSVQ